MASPQQATTSTDPYPFTPRLLVSALLIGALAGALGWLINLFLQNYFIQPVFCSGSDSSAICSNGSAIAWSLAHVLTVGASVVAMVGAAIYRPLLVGLAAFVTVWGIHSWLGNLEWWSATLWEALIFALAYATYAWIARTIQFWAAAAATVVVVVLCRLVLSWA
jgi:hypothetical protein